MTDIDENQENERKLRETGCVTKGFALAGLASIMACRRYMSCVGGTPPTKGLGIGVHSKHHEAEAR